MGALAAVAAGAGVVVAAGAAAVWAWVREKAPARALDALGPVRYRLGETDHVFTRGLIALKGGNLTEEVIEAEMKARLIPISSLFEGEYFETKSVVWVKSL